MTELSSEHSAIDRRLVDALFDIVPEDWRAFRLTIQHPDDASAPKLSLVNPDIAGADATPDAAVRAIVDELIVFLDQEGRRWEQLSYSGHLGPDDEWRLKIVAPLPD